METVEILDNSQFTGCIRAERKGINTLILRKLDHPIKRFDGKQALYELEHRWHSSDYSPVNSIRGNDFTYWQRKELSFKKSLFDQFWCIG